MANKRNPSFDFTDARVDDIVDRLLRGKYETRRPVEALETVHAGLMSSEVCRNYVVARWCDRADRDRGTGDKDRHLSPAGVTMRSNKLWERCQPHVRAVLNGQVESDEFVWRVSDSRTYETVCYASGAAHSAKQWAFTLFGWTIREGARIDEFRTEFAGCGGATAASIANIGLLGRLNQQIETAERAVARELQAAERYRTARDTIASAAALIAG